MHVAYTTIFYYYIIKMQIEYVTGHLSILIGENQ
jgi:hypothetical protein